MDLSINGAKVLAQIELPLMGTVPVTQTLVVSWLVLFLISGLCIWLGSGLKVTGISRKQAAAEMIYSALVNFVRGNMGPELECYIPLIGTIFVTSIVSSLISLAGIWSPTADLMTPLAWALVVFILITYHKIRSAGFVGYLKGFLDPIVLMAPINVMSELFTPISMACRHFGNTLSGMVISALIYSALTIASDALLSAIGSGITVSALLTVIGVVLILLGKRLGRKFPLIAGIITTILGILALLSSLGSDFPWLTVGIPAIPSLYFDWFGSCIQAFIFCTLTTIFIKQAALS